jgi:hypothetical protein
MIFAAVLVMVSKVTAQETMPVELTKSSIKEQIKYIEDRTRIYENYRAIREDMFQKINRNVIDTLSAEKTMISGLNYHITVLDYKNDSLSTALQTVKVNLEKMTDTKDSISVFGIEINKRLYNTIMWIIVVGLLFALSLGFLVFKRVLVVNISTKKEIKDLRDEFEAYRQSARIAREKMSMDHFKEVQKLKGN